MRNVWLKPTFNQWLREIPQSLMAKSIKNKQGNTGNKAKILKAFNKYFTSVGTTLTSKIRLVTKNVSEYLR